MAKKKTAKVTKKVLATKLKKVVKPTTCTFYCRGVKTTNRDFALVESKRLGFTSMGRYIDALLDSRVGQ